MTDSAPPQTVDPRDSPSWAHYRELVEQSKLARAAGRHAEAQRLASAAHKWSMDEAVRLQRLGQAITALREARAHLETAWDKDRSCTTVTELVARYPHLHQLTVACSEAEERVRQLAVAPAPSSPDVSETRGWRAPRGVQGGV